MATNYSSNYLSNISNISEKLKAEYGEKLEQVINVLYQAWQDNKWIYIMGNGGSASTATHLSADLAKTICNNPENKGLKTLALFDNIPLVSAMINDWGWDNLYKNQLITFYETGGVGIGISVHGGNGNDLSGKWSQNVLQGLQYIKNHGGKTIGLSGFDGGAMNQLVDINIVVKAESTPLVESMHSVLAHLIVFGLKEKIYNHK